MRPYKKIISYFWQIISHLQTNIFFPFQLLPKYMKWILIFQFCSRSIRIQHSVAFKRNNISIPYSFCSGVLYKMWLELFAVSFLLKFMAIKWLNRAKITLGFGPKNYVFRCASRKENGLFELVFVKVQCNWLWQGTNWVKKTGRKVESTLKRSLLFCCRQQY